MNARANSRQARSILPGQPMTLALLIVPFDWEGKLKRRRPPPAAGCGFWSTALLRMPTWPTSTVLTTAAATVAAGPSASCDVPARIDTSPARAARPVMTLTAPLRLDESRLRSATDPLVAEPDADSATTGPDKDPLSPPLRRRAPPALVPNPSLAVVDPPVVRPLPASSRSGPPVEDEAVALPL